MKAKRASDGKFQTMIKITYSSQTLLMVGALWMGSMLSCESRQPREDGTTSSSSLYADDAPAPENAVNPEQTLDEFPQLVAASVSGLRLRIAPDPEAEIAGSVGRGEWAEWDGRPSDVQSTVTLGGKPITASWYRVRLSSGKVGWVFGGAVQILERPSPMPSGYSLPDSKWFRTGATWSRLPNGRFQIPYVAGGDFNGDGRQDMAWLLEKNDQWELFICFRQPDGSSDCQAAGGWRSDITYEGALFTGDLGSCVIEAGGVGGELCQYDSQGNLKRKITAGHSPLMFSVWGGDMVALYRVPGEERMEKWFGCE